MLADHGSHGLCVGGIRVPLSPSGGRIRSNAHLGTVCSLVKKYAFDIFYISNNLKLEYCVRISGHAQQSVFTLLGSSCVANIIWRV